MSLRDQNTFVKILDQDYLSQFQPLIKKKPSALNGILRVERKVKGQSVSSW